MKELGADEILKIPATSRRKIFCLLFSYLKTQRLKYKGQKVFPCYVGVELDVSY